MNKNFQDKKILEWGGGYSTLWWAKRSKSVVVFESDQKWYETIIGYAIHNVQIYLTTDCVEDVDQYLQSKKFDVIIIDGLNRLTCARKSLDLINKDGVIILDNSDSYWSNKNEKEYPILDLFKEKGFERIDFYGNAPGVIQTHCTSFFYRQSCFLFRGNDVPKKEVV